MWVRSSLFVSSRSRILPQIWQGLPCNWLKFRSKAKAQNVLLIGESLDKVSQLMPVR